MSGRYDIAPERSRRLAASLSNGAYREVEGAGHYVPIEAPDAVLAVVREALHRVATAALRGAFPSDELDDLRDERR